MKKLFAVCFVVMLFAGCNDGTIGSSQTKLKVKNSSSDNVDVWLTLGNVDGFVTNVSGIFGITGSGLQGKFTLKPGDEKEYTSKKGISGNLSFGTPPINCPTAAYPDGVTIFEFCLNNAAQAGTPQETVDISGVAGVHCLLKAALSGGGTWNAGSDHPGITSFENKELYSNTGLIGVFPYGCDNCTSSDAPPDCPGHPAYETPQAEKICTIQRDAAKSGGTVEVEFAEFIS